MAYRTIYSRVLSIWENVMSKDALSEAKHIKQVSDAQISIASLLVYANYIALFFNFISSTHTNKNIIVRQAWELHKTGSICTILSALCGSDSNFRRKSMLWRNLSGRSKSAKSRIQLLLLKLTFFMCSRWSQWFACFFFYRTQLPRSFTVFFQEGFSCDEKKSSAKRPTRVQFRFYRRNWSSRLSPISRTTNPAKPLFRILRGVLIHDRHKSSYGGKIRIREEIRRPDGTSLVTIQKPSERIIPK